MKNFMTFNAAFPDDSETDEAGSITKPSGHELANRLTEILGGILPHVSGPAQHSFYGWAVAATDGTRKYWFLLQYADPWLLIAEDRTGLLNKLRSAPTSLAAVLDKLAHRLSQDRLITNVQRFSRQEFEAAGQ